MLTAAAAPSPDRAPVVLVTGASGGLGLALVRLLCTASYRVVATARESSLKLLAEAGLHDNEHFWTRALDVTCSDQRVRLIEEIQDRWGGVDILVNNAGVAYRTVVEHFTEWGRYDQMNVNFRSPMELIRLVLPGMRARRAGRIINVSSVVATGMVPSVAVLPTAENRNLGGIPLTILRTQFVRMAMKWIAWTALWLIGTGGWAARGAAAPDFTRKVRPLLSRYCFKCHGPDDQTRKGGLRLDLPASAVAPAKSGKSAIVPGKPDHSELVARIEAASPDDLMPPPATKTSLTAEQRDILRRWIAAGGEYVQHWAFVAPRAVTPPASPDAKLTHPIDRFIRARQAALGLVAAPEADRDTLLRRVSLDLIGLPPTAAETAAFRDDTAPGAYERLVDRLLASPHYGERWARRWLDLARYSDTNGYEKDRARSMWPWRDWVIRALNADLPFDQFTLWQLAGDLLSPTNLPPGLATLDPVVATGFHRNTMLNEEGGIDPLEFRFHAVVDRVATTGVTWLGLTVGCAQCHTHKFDPILHREYYQMMACFNNADEPEIEVPRPGDAARREELTRKIRQLTSTLADRWPVTNVTWEILTPTAVTNASGQPAQVLADGSTLLRVPSPETETTTVSLAVPPGTITHVRLEALTDDSLPNKGPGRTPHGNFVLSEVRVTATTRGSATPAKRIRLSSAVADAAQSGFPAGNVLDGQPDTGWAVHEEGKPLNQSRTLTLVLAEPLEATAGTTLDVRLEQLHGFKHTLGRIRLSAGRHVADQPIATQRQESLDRAYRQWRAEQRKGLTPWQPLAPSRAQSNLPLLTVEPDGSILASGDISKSDTYELLFRDLPAGTTALRLEVLPDDRLPGHGPGLTYYEGPKGDFFLGELTVTAAGQPVRLHQASESYAKNAFGSQASAALAIDGDPQTGWSTAGRPGEAHEAVFNFVTPPAAGREVAVKLSFGRHYACSLGRFRISFTTDPARARASAVPAEVRSILGRPETGWSVAEQQAVREAFVLAAPELAGARQEIERARQAMPRPPTTLVMRERPANHPRPTFIHHRGEFLQPTTPVTPGVFSFLPGLPPGTPTNRLGFARWLVSPEHPLTSRVTVNRQWQAFFGRGLVRTTEDFGFQGEAPTHPELLDWLALEFIRDGWSLKRLDRLIVTSATYRQASRATPSTAENSRLNPDNSLLWRYPRVRLEAEQIRDSVLQVSGLLSAKVGGPSVFPPQPAGVTTEGTYGAMSWSVSTGEDRYRRGLYTYSKRTTPYAMFSTFDGPSGEACVARREVSNTPLQALTLLNDSVITEAAQALGTRYAARDGAVSLRLGQLFQQCLGRPGDALELAALSEFFDVQLQRLRAGELKASSLAGPGDGDPIQRAAWTTVARAILNLDEMVTKG